MRKNKIHILSTGPLGDELRTEAEQNDIAIDEIPFIQTQDLTDDRTKREIMDLCDQTIAAVFSSVHAVHAVNAVAAVAPHPFSWKIYCIGNATQESVRRLLETATIAATAPNAVALSSRICEDKAVKEITFFCGDRRRDDLPVILRKNGITVREITVYRTIAIPVAITKRYDALLFFSPSAVQSFYSSNPIDHTIKVFAIGSTTAAEIKKYTGQPVIIAQNPGKEELLRLAIIHFSKTRMI